MSSTRAAGGPRSSILDPRSTATRPIANLNHTDVDRSELHNLAEQEPERLQEMINLWYAEAGANSAFPLEDRGALEIFITPRPVMTPPRDLYVYLLERG